MGRKGRLAGAEINRGTEKRENIEEEEEEEA